MQITKEKFDQIQSGEGVAKEPRKSVIIGDVSALTEEVAQLKA
jgi:hypothetical protein